MTKRNKRFLDEFRTWLEAKGLSEKTVNNHVGNADFYINDYLPHEDAAEMEDGVEFLDDFFGDFFIRKCLWSTPASIKTTAASVKKFYRCMMELGHISEDDYAFVCDEIKDGLPDWQRECEAYNNGEDWEDDDEFVPIEELRAGLLMLPDYMYDLAFAFKAAKPWKMIREEEIFAVSLSGGRIGYCCVMGRGGDHIALSLYPGDEAFQTFYRLIAIDPLAARMARPQDLLQQDCVQVSLENKEFLEDEDIEAVRAYAKRRGIVLRGPHTYPSFTRHTPYCIPWFITEEQDQRDLVAALEGTLALIRCLEDRDKEDICLRSVYDGPREIPLIEKKGEEDFRIRTTPMPAPCETSWPEAANVNDISVAKLKSRKQKGILECEVIRSPAPVRGEGSAAPYLPALLIPVDQQTGRVCGIAAAEGRNYDPDELLRRTIETMLQVQIYPKEIRVRTEETEALLRVFCRKARIKLSRVEELPALDRAVASLDEDLDPESEDFDPDDAEGAVAELVEALEGLNDQELRSMPAEMFEGTMMLMEFGMLPEGLTKRLKRIFGL